MDCYVGEEEVKCMFCNGHFSEDNAGEQWMQYSKFSGERILYCKHIQKISTYFLLMHHCVYDILYFTAKDFSFTTGVLRILAIKQSIRY